MDKSTITELNKAALTNVIIYRSNALYGTAIYGTNAYGDFDARLVELTIDDIKAELAKEENLIGQSYIDVCNYNYGLVGQSLAIQTQIDLAKAWLSNDSQVKALIDQTKAAIDELRAQGIKAGLLKIRMFRPFPAEEVADSLKNAKAIAVLDKADSLNGVGGALFEDVVSGMYVSNIHVPTVNYVYGIGGRDTTVNEIKQVYTDLAKIAETGDIGDPYRYLGLRRK